MNIDKYKKAMQEIPVNTDKITNGFVNMIYEKSKYRRMFRPMYLRKAVILCLVSFVIVYVISINLFNDGSNSNYTITVYASEIKKEIILSDTPITLSTSNKFNALGITNNETGSINFDLNLKCEGENIKNITYKLSDKAISIADRHEVVAWFAENTSYDTETNLIPMDDENVYESYSYNNKRSVTKMIGNLYSVDYENQNDKHYALVISLDKDDEGNFIADNFTITVMLTLTDGTTLKKQISVHPIIGDVTNYKTPNDMPKIQMSLKH